MIEKWQKVKETLFLGIFAMVWKFVWWFIIALLCCSYSESLNGRNVQTELAGDWIVVLAVVAAGMGALSLGLTIQYSFAQEKAIAQRSKEYNERTEAEKQA